MKQRVHIALSIPAKRGLLLNLLEGAPAQCHQMLLQPNTRLLGPLQRITLKLAEEIQQERARRRLPEPDPVPAAAGDIPCKEPDKLDCGEVLASVCDF